MKLSEYGLLEDTIIVFDSDHGDMIGDHNFLRKSVPYQGSIHIPLIVYDPGKNLGDNKDSKLDEIVELRDIMPSLLDFCDIEIPESVEGKSIKDLINGTKESQRDYLNGEHAYEDLSNHYILDKDYKYVWYSQSGKEQIFDIKNDPKEVNDLKDDQTKASLIKDYRGKVVKELKNRPERYIKEGNLQVGCEVRDTLEWGCCKLIDI